VFSYKRSLLAFLVAVPLVFAGLIQAQAQPDADDQEAASGGPVVDTASKSEQAATEEYWTPKRMANATPMEAHTVVDEESLGAQVSTAPPGPAGVSGGALPAKQGGAEAVTAASDDEQPVFGEAQHGTKPTNPLDGPYGPFQRFTLIGKFINYPASTIGKLFFTLNSQNFVCSASVIGTREIVTAGHCVSDGAGTFASVITFCPSFNQGGVNPQRGCWSRTGTVTSGSWHFSGDPDFDYAKVQLATMGTVHNNSVGNITGSMSFGWNWGNSHAEMSFGYPQGAPFDGTVITQVPSAIWYEHDFTAGSQVSKVMGNDMTGGSSGGPWVLNWSHVNAERPDTDGSDATDPKPLGVPFVVGVNSHKRCVTSCQVPPTTTNGLFWQEMTSPPSIASGASAEDWFDILTFVFS